MAYRKDKYMKRIIGVRFKRLGKIYFFDPKWLEVKKGENVVVETAQGEEIAEVVIPNRMIDEEKLANPLKKVLRLASTRDLKHAEDCRKKEKEAFELCPLDGRYSDIKELMSPYFSEYAYFQKRVFVEIEWLLYLIDTKVVNYKGDISKIKEISSKYDMNSYLEIKKQENITKHDVKAVEYFIDEKLKENNLSDLVSYVHFTLTSEDVNNVAYALMIKEFLNEVYYSKVEELLYYFSILSKKYKNISVLAHTHGQPATPTTFKKEFNVYIYRIKNELKRLKKTKIMAKFNGATGNYSAIKIALPNIDVVSFSKKFITSLNLTFNPLTTQIENHDYIVNILDNIRHINNIILDLDLDMWLYISKSYFKLKVVENEVGSSTMPHKVNPINLKIANQI